MASEGLNHGDNLELILEAAIARFGEPLHLPEFEKQAKLLFWDLEPKAVIEDTRERNADGTFISNQQLAEREYTTWANASTTSMNMVRGRARNDAGFGSCTPNRTD